jgi:hypothetical protein
MIQLGGEVLCNILNEFGIPTKLVRLIETCLSETYKSVWIGKHLSDMFPIKNVLKHGDALTPLFCNFASEYYIRRVQIYQDGLKCNVTHQFLVYVENIIILVESIFPTKNTEASFVASKEIELEINAYRLIT